MHWESLIIVLIIFNFNYYYDGRSMTMCVYNHRYDRAVVPITDQTHILYTGPQSYPLSQGSPESEECIIRADRRPTWAIQTYSWSSCTVKVTIYKYLTFRFLYTYLILPRLHSLLVAYYMQVIKDYNNCSLTTQLTKDI